MTLRVTTPDGIFQCGWIVDVTGPGLRVKCYPESETQDLDLFLMRATVAPGDGAPFRGSRGTNANATYTPNPNVCSWANCEAMLRMSPTRANWGYPNSGLEACEGGPQGDQWRGLGFCANPRLDIDNNLSEGTGLPENINVDNPRNGEGFRIMVQNFTGRLARPLVNVYWVDGSRERSGRPRTPCPTFKTS